MLPFYHPLRLIEEICMLDQMSGGRFELGVGRGVSPFETGLRRSTSRRRGRCYHEAFQIIMKGLDSDELDVRGQVLPVPQRADDA